MHIKFAELPVLHQDRAKVFIYRALGLSTGCRSANGAGRMALD